MATAEDSQGQKHRTPVVFPIYRRLADGHHFYRIEGPVSFTDIQVIGKRTVVHHVDASAYPERLRIQDMIEGHGGRYLPLEAEEWERRWRSISLHSRQNPGG